MKTLKEQLEDRLKTVEDAYNETGRPKIDFSVYPEDMRKHEEADYTAKIIVEAARKIEKENNPEEIDWGNFSQPKWYPWFIMSPSGFAFYGSLYDRSIACAGSGSRLRVLNEETSDYIGKTFLDVWKDVQLG
ncbi:hypothetical protein D0T49_03630 [Paludibacter sp. 221]|uniref:hypothetical protein n=1 Tax=Paludibacter sp. 221 TaxID=2302939 RepID=UPI0013D67DDE|nr:hypothetical protein [Paludibacter sp. 221]NDV46131.1 hypothetical protein [Paludibacter sp. 221]